MSVTSENHERLTQGITVINAPLLATDYVREYETSKILHFTQDDLHKTKCMVRLFELQ